MDCARLGLQKLKLICKCLHWVGHERKRLSPNEMTASRQFVLQFAAGQFGRLVANDLIGEDAIRLTYVPA